MELRKYPRTPHLPFSGSKTSDDITGSDWDFLAENLEVVVTEKMDGESTTLYTNGFHARSLDSNFHESRSWVVNMWGNISWRIPENMRVILENCYAEHSIRYDSLPTFAFGIGVVEEVNGDSRFLSWDDTLEIFETLEITPVPQLYRGTVTIPKLKEIFDSLDSDRQEGLVVRTAGMFREDVFGRNVGKAVRRGHVQTTDHWTKTWKPNALASS